MAGRSEAGLGNSDQHLVEEFRESGRADVLEELLRRHLRPIRNLVFQMLLDHDDADDTAQEVFLRVVRGIDRFEGRADFSTWLFRIAMNTAKTALRSRSRSPVQLHPELTDKLTGSATAPDGVMMESELKANIQTALGGLTTPLRAAVVLVCLQGQSVAVAAEIEGCSTNTIYWRVHEARRHLKKLLAEHL